MNTRTKKLTAAMQKKRAAEGLSLRALADIVGVSFSSLARIERGEGEPDNNSAIRILEWLGDHAEDTGFDFEQVGLAHFRAGKNIDSQTINCLVQISKLLKKQSGFSEYRDTQGTHQNFFPDPPTTKDEMEARSEKFRSDLGLSETDPFDSLKLRIQGVDIVEIEEIQELDATCASHLLNCGSSLWSAMSVPLDENFEKWNVILNRNHTLERQRVTYLEECWHIMLGHKLTKISKIGKVYGRTFEQNEEHDAFYLAASSLLPKSVVSQFVKSKADPNEFSQKYGVSPELLEYRIKRLHLWPEYKGKAVSLSDS